MTPIAKGQIGRRDRGDAGGGVGGVGDEETCDEASPLVVSATLM
jgi:hypothetical protein